MSSAHDNPSVNRYLKDKWIDHIDHALGRPVWPLRASYRNYFATGVGGDLAKKFEESPLWELRNVAQRMAWFSVTEAGRETLDRYLKSQADQHRAYVVDFESYSTVVVGRSPANARYSYFLRISDCCPDLSFGDFVRRCRVRLAA
jgi:hypothetical protein